MIRPSLRIAKLILGVFLVIFGVVAFVIPLFPFAWVAFIGLELLGIRLAFWGKIKSWFQRKRGGGKVYVCGNFSGKF